MASGRLFKRSGTKFRFRGLPEDPKIIITDPFYEEKGGMTTTTRHDNSETPEPSQPPSSSHSGMKYLVRTSPHFDPRRPFIVEKQAQNKLGTWGKNKVEIEQR